ncbi:Signal recognition particle subunit SRP72 [Orchesella cincta]|uniref:Signal recognition particle subunit SRP72 n=1 Tax=Orchesella cincta TaxID=48709 RepID=A0A1D2MY36_ORCCI|nr:Signal recognition particle subunit SRP72 [Orchesella cincta]
MKKPQQKDKASLFSDIDKYLLNGDYERAIKDCNRVLHLAPDNELAFRCKIICCIHLDRVSDAIMFMSKNPKMVGKLGFETAYCYYRLQDMKTAKEILDKCEDSVCKKELMTQILYRMEMYDEAYNSCKEVIRISKDEYDEERQTNLAAINASLIGSGFERRLENVDHHDTHELRYNMACALIGEKRYVEAIKLLKTAEVKAVETLKEEGLSEEEIGKDVAVMTIQSGYCRQKLGRQKEAIELYSKALKNKVRDPDLVAVASNNILCINRDHNVFDSQKRIKAIRADGAEAKLTRAQRRDMHINQCLFYLLTGQADLCKETCALTASKFPETEHEIFLINTALILKTDGIEAAKTFVAPTVGQTEDMQLRISLCFVQQLLRDRNRKDAISILESLAEKSYKPGIIGALVTLYQQEGRVNDAAATLKQAVDFHRKGGGNKKYLNVLWRHSASPMIQQGDLGEAVKSLEELQKSSPDDITTLAQLIVAYSRYDIKKAHKLISQLPPVTPPDDLDLATLESPNWLSSIKMMKKSTKSDSVPATPQISAIAVSVSEPMKKKKKPKCKSKLPKTFDPEYKPDPERWLPKHERTGNRWRKQRRGNLDVGKGTQGVDSATSVAYDMSARILLRKESELSSSTSKSSVGTPKKSNRKGQHGGSRR